MNKLSRILLFSLLLCTTLAACSNSSDSNTTNDQTDASSTKIALPSYASEALPANLDWQTNNEDPIFSDPRAERGGTFNTWIFSYPLTLRLVGPDSNGSFAHFIRGNRMALVSRHPNTRNPIPSLATHWAFAADGKTVYYKLDPDARWSDGEAVTADDYMFAIDFMRSEHIVEPWYNHHFSQVVVDVKKHDRHIISVTGATVKPQKELLFEYGIQPIARHFHQLDENWVQNYNWKIEPNTGPYQISNIKKGKTITYRRKTGWWANDKRYYTNRYNPDKIRIKVIRDQEIAYKHFLKGDIDSFNIVRPKFWHDKATGELFDKGFIQKTMFYNDRPQPAYGMWLNTDDPILSDANIRKGIAHATNIHKVIERILRSDYQRLQTHHVGYGEYDNTTIKARQFDLTKANEYFDAAGWSERDKNGIRTKNGDTLSLSIVFANPDDLQRLVVIKEEAKKAGLEFILQQLDSSASFKKILEKKHQIAWMAWAGGGFAPRFWEFYHSANAHKPQTNNITNWDDPEMDSLIDRYRAETKQEQRYLLSQQLEQKIHDAAILIPTFKVPYTRAAHWRWLKLPSSIGTRSTNDLFDPTDGLFWIDQSVETNTLAAKKAGKQFPAQTKIDKRFMR